MIAFDCSECGKKLKVPHDAGGKRAKCPHCGRIAQVPEAAGAIPFAEAPAQLQSAIASPLAQQTPVERVPAAAGAEMIFCPKCRQENLENNYKCSQCGFVLHAPMQAQYAVTDDGTMGGLIPYKNAQALWAYYLGVFSLIPCVGIPLGIAGFVLGIRGLKYAELHPEAKGKAHAWTGIILGGITAIAYTVIGVVVIVAARR